MLGALILIPALSYFLLRERGTASRRCCGSRQSLNPLNVQGMPHALTTSE